MQRRVVRVRSSWRAGNARALVGSSSSAFLACLRPAPAPQHSYICAPAPALVYFTFAFPWVPSCPTGRPLAPRSGRAGCHHLRMQGVQAPSPVRVCPVRARNPNRVSALCRAVLGQWVPRRLAGREVPRSCSLGGATQGWAPEGVCARRGPGQAFLLSFVCVRLPGPSYKYISRGAVMTCKPCGKPAPSPVHPLPFSRASPSHSDM